MDSNKTRDERYEDYYQGWAASDMADRLVTLEDSHAQLKAALQECQKYLLAASPITQAQRMKDLVATALGSDKAECEACKAGLHIRNQDEPGGASHS